MSTIIQCPNCGSPKHDLGEDGKVKCRACGSIYFENTGEQFAKDADKFSEDKDIQRLRENIRSEIDNAKADVNQIRTFCNEILKVYPEDFLANLYLSYVTSTESPERYINCLHTDLSNVDDFAVLEAVEFITDKFSLKYENDIVFFAENCAKRLGISKENYLKKISNIKRQIEIDTDRYAKVPRDVFICFVSNDKTKAYEVHDFLSNENVSHFFSPWNLYQSTVDNYWKSLNYAIEHAKVFLVISSYYTEHNEAGRNDALVEMEYAEKNTQPSTLRI